MGKGVCIKDLSNLSSSSSLTINHIHCTLHRELYMRTKGLIIVDDHIGFNEVHQGKEQRQKKKEGFFQRYAVYL